jgi:hypothetical protein
MFNDARSRQLICFNLATHFVGLDFVASPDKSHLINVTGEAEARTMFPVTDLPGTN